MGVSLRAYARHREASDTAVRKAIKSGRIQTEPDGTIDVDKVDKQWALNTDQAQQRKPKGVFFQSLYSQLSCCNLMRLVCAFSTSLAVRACI
jgi:hypothetical protein